MTDTARVLLTAAVLSASAAAVFAARVRRTDPAQPARLIGELRLAQWAAVIQAAIGAVPIGAAVVRPDLPTAHLDATLGVLFVLPAAVILLREPRQALLIAAGGFLLQALVGLAHRPGWLWPDPAPPWFTVGVATYRVCLAAICYWASRR